MAQEAKIIMSIAKGKARLCFISSMVCKTDRATFLLGQTKFQQKAAKGHPQNRWNNVSSCWQSITTQLYVSKWNVFLLSRFLVFTLSWSTIQKKLCAWVDMMCSKPTENVVEQFWPNHAIVCFGKNCRHLVVLEKNSHIPYMQCIDRCQWRWKGDPGLYISSYHHHSQIELLIMIHIDVCFPCSTTAN